MGRVMSQHEAAGVAEAEVTVGVACALVDAGIDGLGEGFLLCVGQGDAENTILNRTFAKVFGVFPLCSEGSRKKFRFAVVLNDG